MSKKLKIYQINVADPPKQNMFGTNKYVFK